MFLVPIFLSNKKTTHLRQFWLFLERNGTHLIEINSPEEAAPFLEENGLPSASSPFVVENYVFAPIKPCAELADFYTWSETPPGTTPPREAWRPFLWWVASPAESEDSWGINSILDTIVLAEPHSSVYVVLSSFLESPEGILILSTP